MCPAQQQGSANFVVPPGQPQLRQQVLKRAETVPGLAELVDDAGVANVFGGIDPSTTRTGSAGDEETFSIPVAQRRCPDAECIG